MTVTIFILNAMKGDVDINLIDVWYKENYWTTTSKLLGGTKTGSFNYNKGHRKVTLRDEAGTVIFEISDFDFPPYHINDRQVVGRAFYNIKDKPLRYGEHRWFHNADNK